MAQLQDLSAYPDLERLVRVQLDVWPDHERFIATRLAQASLSFAEEVAGLIGRIAPSLRDFATDYQWLCGRLYEEELYFRRTGAYRLSRFEDAVREVYANREYMSRYMNAVLLSHLWWENHSRVIEYYSRDFLRALPDDYTHLEVGPGHGLLLYFAARDSRCWQVTGWDVSEASLDATRACLQRLHVTRDVRLVKRNLLDAPTGGERFDSIVISEVCEHLEDPRAALASLRDHLAPKGRLFVNVPVNSPAPDHIYLFSTPEEGVDLVASAGYQIVETRFFPMTGHSEARARKSKSTISCVVVASPAA
jgi:2-polyprenyl-3-methyl-5-hydroxy-6-metoxy-1,4-benzoquinol methylase